MAAPVFELRMLCMFAINKLLNCEQGSSACLFQKTRHQNESNEDKQREPIIMGLRRLSLKLIKHVADTTCVSLSPAGQTS